MRFHLPMHPAQQNATFLPSVTVVTVGSIGSPEMGHRVFTAVVFDPQLQPGHSQSAFRFPPAAAVLAAAQHLAEHLPVHLPVA